MCDEHDGGVLNTKLYSQYLYYYDLYFSLNNRTTYCLWKAPYLIFGRTGDPRENCWKVRRKESFHHFLFQGGTFWKLDPKANFLESNAFSFSSFFDSP